MNFLKYVALIVVVGALGFAAGRFTHEPKVVEKDRIVLVEAEKTVEYDHSKFLVWDFNRTAEQDRKVNTRKKTTSTTTKTPDGTETTTTTVVENTTEETGTKTGESSTGAAGEQERVRVEERLVYVDRERIVEKSVHSDWGAGLGVSVDPINLIRGKGLDLELGVEAARRIAGPFWLAPKLATDFDSVKVGVGLRVEW